MNLEEMTNEGLIQEYLSATNSYVDLTKRSSIMDITSFSNFGKAKDYLMKIKRELHRRGIKVKRYN